MNPIKEKLFKKKIVHNIEAKKNFTLMLIPDPTKSARVIKIPKLPVLLGVFAVLILCVMGTSYVTSLKYKMLLTKSENQTIAATLTDKDAEIDKLEDTNKNHYSQLQELQSLAKDLDHKLGELEEYKEEIDSKLNSTGKGTGSQPSEAIIVEQAEPIVNIRDEEALPKEDAFENQIKVLAEGLKEGIAAADETAVAYEGLNSRIDELIPYWESYPSGSPLSRTSINSEYGWRSDPINRRTDFHTGIDLKAKYEPVYATGKGTVINAGYESGYGYTVEINHGYGYRTLYAHNSKLLVSVGDTVVRGEQIAVSGASGRVTGSHLHYEVIYKGQTQNPLYYIY